MERPPGFWAKYIDGKQSGQAIAKKQKRKMEITTGNDGLNVDLQLWDENEAKYPVSMVVSLH